MEKLPVREQHELFFFIFDKKLVYIKNQGYRTSEMPTAARLFEDFATVDSSNVDPSGFEPLTSSLQMKRSTNWAKGPFGDFKTIPHPIYVALGLPNG